MQKHFLAEICLLSPPVRVRHIWCSSVLKSAEQWGAMFPTFRTFYEWQHTCVLVSRLWQKVRTCDKCSFKTSCHHTGTWSHKHRIFLTKSCQHRRASMMASCGYRPPFFPLKHFMPLGTAHCGEAWQKRVEATTANQHRSMPFDINYDKEFCLTIVECKRQPIRTFLDDIFKSHGTCSQQP